MATMRRGRSRVEIASVRFSCTSFAPPGRPLSVVGNCDELGNWDPHRGQTMACSLGRTRLLSEPDYHWVDVVLPLERAHQVEYKFIELGPDGSVVWEELSRRGNRQLAIDGEEFDGIMLLPVEKFGSSDSESDHTASFYSGVKERGEISVRRVTSKLFIGSCPRSVAHIDYLRSLGITAVTNFQADEDCRNNCVPGIGMEEEPEAVRALYEQRGMRYYWMPTADMSTEGRVDMLPGASKTFAELIRAGHVVYSHCNAGVGRSVSAACGYMTYVLHYSDRQMQHAVASSRPAAYFDFDALQRAKPRYDSLYGPRADLRRNALDEARAFLNSLPSIAVAPAGSVAVRFGVAYLRGVEGSEVRLAVVGSCPELGSWQPSEGAEMHRSGPHLHYVDVWISTDDSQREVEFKFVRVDDGHSDWEEFGVVANRHVDLQDAVARARLCLPLEILLPLEKFGELVSDEKHREEIAERITQPRAHG